MRKSREMNGASGAAWEEAVSEELEAMEVRALSHVSVVRRRSQDVVSKFVWLLSIESVWSGVDRIRVDVVQVSSWVWCVIRVSSIAPILSDVELSSSSSCSTDQNAAGSRGAQDVGACAPVCLVIPEPRTPNPSTPDPRPWILNPRLWTRHCGP
eukprot:73070-Rhodomonas_salina.1